MFSKLRKTITEIGLKNLPPSLLLKYRELRKKDFEPEFILLPFLCDKNKTSIDVGANLGSYTSRMVKYSKTCWAFEPVPQLAKFLSRAFEPSVRVEQVALSSKNGNTELKIPIEGYAFTSIEEKNLSAKITKVKKIYVPLRKLDDYNIEEVGFIKIDVEGHEEDVLIGGRELLIKYRPVLLIEAEERHKPHAVERIKKFLEEFGYQGFFISNNKLVSIDHFQIGLQPQIKQSQNIRKEISKGHYINNFIFVTKQDLKKLSKFLP